MARPTLYTQELGDYICGEIMSGKPLVRILAQDNMPEPATIYRWFRIHPEFCDNYARAKEDQADYFAEDIVQIADMAKPDTVQVDKLKVDTRKWVASKFKPKKYGDKITQEHTGDAFSLLADAIMNKTEGLPDA